MRLLLSMAILLILLSNLVSAAERIYFQDFEVDATNHSWKADFNAGGWDGADDVPENDGVQRVRNRAFTGDWSIRGNLRPWVPASGAPEYPNFNNLEPYVDLIPYEDPITGSTIRTSQFEFAPDVLEGMDEAFIRFRFRFDDTTWSGIHDSGWSDGCGADPHLNDGELTLHDGFAGKLTYITDGQCNPSTGTYYMGMSSSSTFSNNGCFRDYYRDSHDWGTYNDDGRGGFYFYDREFTIDSDGVWRKFELYYNRDSDYIQIWVDGHPVKGEHTTDLQNGIIATPPTFLLQGLQPFYTYGCWHVYSTSDAPGEYTDGWHIDDIEIWNGLPSDMTGDIADVTITSVSDGGVLVHGQNFSISGVNFGSKYPVAPKIWDDFESGDDGDLISTHSPWWISSDNLVVDQPQFDDEVSYAGDSSLITPQPELIPYGEPGSNYGWDEARHDGLNVEAGDKYILSVWLRWDWEGPSPAPAPEGGTRQHKYLGLHDGSSDTYPEVMLSWNRNGCGFSEVTPVGCPHIMCTDESGNTLSNDICNDGTQSFYLDGLGEVTDLQPDTHTWHNFVYYGQMSTPGNCDGWLHSEWNFEDFVSRNVLNLRSDTGGLHQLRLGKYTGSDEAPDDYYDRHHFWFDNVYVDESWARIEVGNNRVYEDCTHREFQIPHSMWDEDNIEFTANLGSFDASDDLYLFVVDEFGNVSDGYSVDASFANPVCGDGICNGDETCSSCFGDCGVCSGPGDLNEDGIVNFSDFFIIESLSELVLVGRNFGTMYS